MAATLGHFSPLRGACSQGAAPPEISRFAKTPLAREILVDNEGLAARGLIVDRQTGKEEEIRARVMVVCCAQWNPRAAAQFTIELPSAGLGNSSGVVGRYLHGHLGGQVHVYLEDLGGLPPFNQDGATGSRLHPTLSNQDQRCAFGFQVNFEN